MNQGKLEVAKQEMAGVNINILGISELKWIKRGKFNSDGHYIYYCEQESFRRRNKVALIVNKRVQRAVLGCSLKNNRMICLFPRQTIQYHSNPSICPNQSYWRSWSWMVVRRPTRPSKTNTKKGCPFHLRGLECKSKKSRVTWSNRQVWLGVENEAGQRLTVLSREFTDHGKHPLATTQEMTTNGHHQMVNTELRLIIYLAAKIKKLYTVSKNKMRSWLWPRSWTPSCKIQTFAKLKKVGKTTRPSSFDLNQIPYDYTVEVTNRFKELDLIERVPGELWTEICDIVQEAVIKTIPQKKKCKKAKWLSEEAL